VQALGYMLFERGGLNAGSGYPLGAVVRICGLSTLNLSGVLWHTKGSSEDGR